LIEDSPGECELFRLALAQTGLDVALYTEQDAEAALRFLEVKAKAEVKVPASTTGENQPHELLSHINSCSTSASTLTSYPCSASTGDRSGLPSLILLDLHLCGQNGCDLLKRLRSDARFAAIPVVIFTTSDDQNDLARCYTSGANGYVVKPGTFDELVHCTGDLCRYWLTWNRSMVNPEC
jgi:CheY-like chemotaxis protein